MQSALELTAKSPACAVVSMFDCDVRFKSKSTVIVMFEGHGAVMM
jgi:hypothetical protein